MSLPRRLLPALFFSLFAGPLVTPPGVVVAQENEEEWDVTLARGDTREIDFETDEGTWMSVDVSPDGQWVVFDLLAHVYRIPISGGRAESLTQESGVAVNYHPQYSPDGSLIAFVSDRGGQNNLWVMDADGSNPRQVQSDLETRVTEPTWTPDGEYILVAQSGGIWMYHRDGGQGVEVAPASDGRAAWPSVSPDGRYLYYQVRTPGQPVPWAHDGVEPGIVQDALQGNVNLRRKDLRSGVVTRGHERNAVAAIPPLGGRWVRRGGLPGWPVDRLRSPASGCDHRVEGPSVRPEHGAVDSRPRDRGRTNRHGSDHPGHGGGDEDPPESSRAIHGRRTGAPS